MPEPAVFTLRPQHRYPCQQPAPQARADAGRARAHQGRCAASATTTRVAIRPAYRRRRCRLHVKMFLWFWLGVVVVSGTLIGLTELTHSRAEDDRLWREKYGPRVDLWARQETHILRTKGSAALEVYVGSFQSDPGVLNYMFDAAGHEVFDRTPAKPVLNIIDSLRSHQDGRSVSILGAHHRGAGHRCERQSL